MERGVAGHGPIDPARVFSGADDHDRCDVSDEASLGRSLLEARASGPIHGVVHAAGFIRDGLMKSGEALQGLSAVWSAKAVESASASESASVESPSESPSESASKSASEAASDATWRLLPCAIVESPSESASASEAASDAT